MIESVATAAKVRVTRRKLHLSHTFASERVRTNQVQAPAASTRSPRPGRPSAAPRAPRTTARAPCSSPRPPPGRRARRLAARRSAAGSGADVGRVEGPTPVSARRAAGRSRGRRDRREAGLGRAVGVEDAVAAVTDAHGEQTAAARAGERTGDVAGRVGARLPVGDEHAGARARAAAQGAVAAQRGEPWRMSSRSCSPAEGAALLRVPTGGASRRTRARSGSEQMQHVIGQPGEPARHVRHGVAAGGRRRRRAPARAASRRRRSATPPSSARRRRRRTPATACARSAGAWSAQQAARPRPRDRRRRPRRARPAARGRGGRQAQDGARGQSARRAEPHRPAPRAGSRAASASSAPSGVRRVSVEEKRCQH